LEIWWVLHVFATKNGLLTNKDWGVEQQKCSFDQHDILPSSMYHPYFPIYHPYFPRGIAYVYYWI